MKYTLVNGWTKAKMKAAIQKYNNGTQARYTSVYSSACAYQTPDGNRCAIGCFLPDEHPALHYSGRAGNLMSTYSDINLPITDVFMAESFQDVHDKDMFRDLDPSSPQLHQALFNWIDNNVIDPENE